MEPYTRNSRLKSRRFRKFSRFPRKLPLPRCLLDAQAGKNTGERAEITRAPNEVPSASASAQCLAKLAADLDLPPGHVVFVLPGENPESKTLTDQFGFLVGSSPRDLEILAAT